MALPPAEQDRVLARFHEFARLNCGRELDADLSLEFTLLGRVTHARGMILAAPPALLRYTTLDPLDRPLNILVTDGRSYTLVDNQEGRAVTGPVGAGPWGEYLPGAIRARDLPPLLTGRVTGDRVSVDAVRGDPDSPSTAWLIQEPVNGVSQVIGFDRDRGVLLQHRYLDGDGSALLDVRYREYEQDGSGCLRPKQVEVRGASVRGTLVIRYDRFYPTTEMDPARFRLRIPDHYTVRTVE